MGTSSAIINKKGLRTSKLSTTIGISLVLFLIGLVLAGLFGLNSVQTKAKEELHGDLFFKSEYNTSDIKQVEQSLKSWDCFAEVEFISPERAISEFQGSDENANDILAVYEGENPLPPTINFRPKVNFATKQGMRKIKNRLFTSFGNMLTEVNYDENAVQEVNLGFKQIAFLILLVASLLILIAIAMINNTIRLALFSKRFNIKTMQLVGASGKFIRRPFMREAILQGISSAIIGFAMVLLVFFALNNVLSIIEIQLSPIQFCLLFVVLISAGILLSGISTWFALSKYLKTKLDDLY